MAVAPRRAFARSPRSPPPRSSPPRAPPPPGWRLTPRPVRPPPPPPPGWTLAWRDEFDGPAGAAADPARWVADTGGQGWGNQEREYYTAGAENAALDGRGTLVITARAEPAGTARRCWYGPCRYTSARLKTKGRFAQAYGRFERACGCRAARGSGRRSGCSATTSTRSAGRGAARST
jgi:hypothetical protein